MEKLQSWNATLWTYWDVLQGSSTAVNTKHAMEMRLIEYKVSMDKVGRMLQDHSRTQFVTVCIAEYLSVMETRRLMKELGEQHVRSGIVICNQLLPDLTREEQAAQAQRSDGEASASATDHPTDDNSNSARALRLINARSRIQQKYLAMLEETPDVRKIIKVELQDREITGRAGLGILCVLIVKIHVETQDKFNLRLARQDWNY